MDTVEQRLCTLATTQSLEPKEVSGGPCQEVDRRDSSFPYPAESQSGPGMGWDTSSGAGPAKGRMAGMDAVQIAQTRRVGQGVSSYWPPGCREGLLRVTFKPLFASWALLRLPWARAVLAAGGIQIRHSGEEIGKGVWEGFPGRVGRAVALVVTLWPLCGGFLAWRPFVQPVAHLKTCLDAAHTVGIQ